MAGGLLFVFIILIVLLGFGFFIISEENSIEQAFRFLKYVIVFPIILLVMGFAAFIIETMYPEQDCPECNCEKVEQVDNPYGVKAEG